MTQKALLQAANDGTAVPAGYVNEVRYSSNTTNTSSSGVTGPSLTLSPGVWLVSGQMAISGTGPTKATLVVEIVSGATSLAFSPIASYAGGDGATIARLNASGLIIQVPSSGVVRTAVSQTVAAASTVDQYISAVRLA